MTAAVVALAVACAVLAAACAVLASAVPYLFRAYLRLEERLDALRGLPADLARVDEVVAELCEAAGLRKGGGSGSV